MCDKENCNCGSNPCCGDCEPWNCIEQAVNDVWSTKEGQIEDLVERAETAAENSEASAKASADSAAEAKEFRDEAETAATTAVAAEGVVLGVAGTLEDTANKLKQIADELGTAIAGIAVVTWYYTILTEGQTIIPVPSDKNELDVQAIYVEGSRQEPNRGFTYDSLNREITLAEGLPAGLEIAIIIGTYSDNPNDFANTLASTNGANLIGTISGKTVQQELLDIKQDIEWLNKNVVVTVLAYGAVGDGETSDTNAFFAAYNDVKALGGGAIRIPGGKVYRASNIILDDDITWFGDGVGSTVVKAPNGSVNDVFVTRDFASLKGVGPLNAAPKRFTLKDLTVDGNYLADYKSAALGADTTVVNTKGYGVRIAGSVYTIDIELVNCPEIGFYSEAVDYTGFGDEQACHINLRGRVFGKEAIIHRGPADVEFGQVIIGCAGWLATQAARQSTVVMSDTFIGEPVHVMVSDESVIDGTSFSYNGHHEFQMMHLYGNLSGYGYFCLNTGRLKGNHLVCENCRGGFKGSTRNWGGIAMLECHNNGRQPSNLAGTLPKFYDIHNLSKQAFNIRAVVRRVLTQQTEYTALRHEGTGGHISLDYFVAGSDTTGSTPGNVVELYCDSATVDINCVNTQGNAVVVAGIANTITCTGKNHVGGGLLRRIAGDSNGNVANNITVVGQNCDALVHFEGLVTVETWSITGFLKTGQLINSGDVLDLYNRSVVAHLSVRIDSAQYSHRDVGRVNLDVTDTTAKTIDVPHHYFQVPDPAQINFNEYDPTPTFTGRLEYLRLQAVSATTLTFAYKLSTTGTSGPIVLLWRVD